MSDGSWDIVTAVLPRKTSVVNISRELYERICRSRILQQNVTRPLPDNTSRHKSMPHRRIRVKKNSIRVASSRKLNLWEWKIHSKPLCCVCDKNHSGSAKRDNRQRETFEQRGAARCSIYHVICAPFYAVALRHVQEENKRDMLY